MQSKQPEFKIWTWVIVSIFYNGNYYSHKHTLYNSLIFLNQRFKEILKLELDFKLLVS